MTTHLRVKVFIAMLLVFMPATGRAVPPEHIDDALRKICERGAATSAAEYCRAQLFIHLENPPQRARWALRHMECLCQAALQSKTGGEQNWTAIATAESEYRSEHADDPRLPWLAWQLARADLLRAQQSLAKWLATPAAQPAREQALQAVRRVQSQMDAVEKDIKERLPLSQTKPSATSEQAPSRQLQELQIDCIALRCEALLVRARCYAADSADHLAALADIDRTATAVLTQSAQDWSARNELIVAQATAGLELGKRQQSMQVLTSVLQGKSVESTTQAEGNAPAAVSQLARLRAGSALVEALCNDGHVEEASQYLSFLKTNFDEPEVELCALRVSLARLAKLSAAQRTEQLKAAVEQARALGDRYGYYWRNRGEALLVAAAGSSNFNNSGSPKTDTPETTAPMTELIAVEVRQLLSGGQVTAAIARLKQATVEANQAKQYPDALNYAVEAAKLMQKEKQWSAAAELLMPLSTERPELTGAPAAHVLAAWCLAQAVAADGKSEQLKHKYEEALEKQLGLWPDAPETLKAEEYLTNWLVMNKRYADLAAMWSHRAAAVSDQKLQLAALGNWLDTVVARLPKNQTLPEAQRFAQEIVAGKLESCRDAATIFAFAGAMLTTALTQAETEALVELKLPGQQLEQASQSRNLLAVLLTIAAARNKDATDAHNSVGLLDHHQLSTTVQLAWCKSLVEALDEVSPEQISAWRPVVELVRMPEDSGQLSPALQMTELRLQQLQAKDASEHKDTLEKIKELAKQHASDALMQLSLAAALAQSGPSSQVSEGIALIKRVAAGTKKDSEAHLRARWLEAQWLLGRGDTAAAAQVASLTLSSKQIEPAWWRKRFEVLAGK